LFLKEYGGQEDRTLRDDLIDNVPVIFHDACSEQVLIVLVPILDPSFSSLSGHKLLHEVVHMPLDLLGCHELLCT
jgi:hypothetical protein